MGFDSVLGQDRAKETLRRMLAQDRLGHASLFTGPDGVGKTLLAQETAKALLCRGASVLDRSRPQQGRTAGLRADERPCDACRDCLLFAHSAHPDFMLLQPEGTSRVIKIEQVRDLIHTLSLKPVQSDRRVAVIQEADALTEEAANALLKTLEEPPSYAFLILTTSRLRSLPATLRSRCQEVRFAPLSPEQVRAILNLPKVKEDLGEVDAEDVLAAVRLANGSADRAIELIESGCLEIRKKALGRVLALPADDAFAIADEVMEWAKAASQRLEPQRERLRAFLYLLESAYRDILVLQVGGDPETLLHPPGAAASPAQRAENPAPERLWSIEEAVWEARRWTDANASMDLVLQNLLLRLSSLQRARLNV
jgi:DNA polymerase-3 subunit delta'